MVWFNLVSHELIIDKRMYNLFTFNFSMGFAPRRKP